MTGETSNENARIVQLETLLSELKARVQALEDRLTTAEQSLSQRWFQ
jgi:BMFP domain-containing protein YqiC